MIELSAKFKNIIFWASTASISLIIFGIFVIDIFVTDADGKDKLSIVFSYLSTIFAFLSALRPGELTGLSWEDIDLVKKTIMVRRNVCGPSDFSYPKTGASTDRIISLLEPAFNCLKDQSLYTKMTAPIDVKVKTREFNKYRTDSCTFVFQPSIVSVNGVLTKFYSPGGFS